MKTFIWIGVVVLVFAAFLFWGTDRNTIKPPFEMNAVHPLDHVKGDPKAKVLIVEYSDFQCPACRNYYPITREIEAEFENKIAFVYRHFPLNNIHANAEFAARASEAAGKQGKFWEMHDLLFEKQAEWADTADIKPLFQSYASLIGISVDQFLVDWNSQEVKNIVKTERNHALKSGLQGTPSFFVNGKQIQNPTSTDAFRIIINEALKNSI